MEQFVINGVNKVLEIRNSGDPVGALEELKKLRYAFPKQNLPEAFAYGIRRIPIRIQQNFALLDYTEGRIHQAMGDFKKAIFLYGKALAYCEQVGDVRGKALTLARMGRCYAELGDMESAGDHFLIALIIFKDMNDTIRIKQVEDDMKEFDLEVPSNE